MLDPEIADDGGDDWSRQQPDFRDTGGSLPVLPEEGHAFQANPRPGDVREVRNAPGRTPARLSGTGDRGVLESSTAPKPSPRSGEDALNSVASQVVAVEIGLRGKTDLAVHVVGRISGEAHAGPD